MFEGGLFKGGAYSRVANSRIYGTEADLRTGHVRCDNIGYVARTIIHPRQTRSHACVPGVAKLSWGIMWHSI